MYEILVMESSGINRIVAKYDNPKTARKAVEDLKSKGFNAEVWHGFSKVVFAEETTEEQK